MIHRWRAHGVITHTVIMAIARFDGEVIAESEDTVVVEGTHYFPPHSVRSGLLRPSHAPRSDGKGNASYYSITVHGRPAADAAAWCFREPLDEAADIKGHIAFASQVSIEE